ncbi:STE3-like pheromone receptor [Crepidotus variabilis]|uniref:STE3-like pheromone receptor n=1 Tax=Crepidotus variabilis TaxID=179855 RepID=A0A9P6E457_9AGAR|nr:STE3-like pheromone receptor [Crepidotus variabilis]
MSLPPSTVLTDPTYPLHPILSFLGFALCLIPLPWHIQASNSATCAFMIWTALWCLNGFVNSVVWRANSSNPAPIWCDISTKFDIGASIGIPAAVLCISRRIYVLMSLNASSMTQREKRRMIILDVLICVGLPVVIMILHYIVQDHRFDILQDIGCYTVIYNTPLAYILVLVWPVILGLISLVYSSLSLRLFIICRNEITRVRDSTSSVSLKRYSRLGIFAILDLVCTVPLGIYSLYLGPRGSTLRPYVSFRESHANFSNVELIPTSEWRSDPSFHFSVELMRWMHVYCAFLFFAAFGLTVDARLHYRNAILKVFKGAEHSYRRLSHMDAWSSDRESDANSYVSS